jgi:SEC-C motif-containing protein
MRCPCHSRRSYKRCCQPYHQGQPAPTPEALMRSRYAAYAKGLVDYVVQTGDPPQDPEGVRLFCAHTRFVGLRITEHVDSEHGPGFVTFAATLVQDGQDASFSERSRFEKRDGRWVYVDGERITG